MSYFLKRQLAFVTSEYGRANAIFLFWMLALLLYAITGCRVGAINYIPVNRKYRHVIGKYRYVNEKYRHVFGKYRHVFGKYRPVNEKYRHVIGKYRLVNERYKPVNVHLRPVSAHYWHLFSVGSLVTLVGYFILKRQDH